MIDFQVDPETYRHWKVSYQNSIATIGMNVDPEGGLVPGYELKLNSYDLGVDIELYDILQRIRFEHPEISVVILSSLKEKVFCAGANIKMLGQLSHANKVNFCKFTNETRNSIEDASNHSGIHFICAVNGTAAGGGYELALAADKIILVDDGSAAVSLPEVPLLAVLPGTGGLTRLVDKRKVRRDHADFFCTAEEGLGGQRALDWNLVDEVIAPSKFKDRVDQRAMETVDLPRHPVGVKGIKLRPLNRVFDGNQIKYDHIEVEIDPVLGTATISLKGPDKPPPLTLDEMITQGVDFWSLAISRELDDLILHLRANQQKTGILVFKSQGDLSLLSAYDEFLLAHREHWLVTETMLYMKRTLKRLDVSSRSIIALVEPGSCFAGSLLEIVLNADRSFMLEGQYEGVDLPPPAIQLSGMNFGPLTTVNGLTRIESRFLDEPAKVKEVEKMQGRALMAAEAAKLRLITFTPDDIDWDDEVRISLEERASLSPDALTGMEANLRFAGPETLESKIFARLSAWQNWIFLRSNAVGEEGALSRYGTGKRSNFTRERV